MIHRQLSTGSRQSPRGGHFLSVGILALLIATTSCNRASPTVKAKQLTDQPTNVASIKIDLPLGLPEYYVRRGNPLT
ncbi:MAG: hypothetical protein AAF497_16475, partial [Planctomycetota bacterium]